MRRADADGTSAGGQHNTLISSMRDGLRGVGGTVLRWIHAGVSGHGPIGHVVRKVAAPLRVSTLRVPLGGNRGLMFNPGGSAPSFSLGVSEPAVQAVLMKTLRPGDVFYDVGANVGFFTVMASRLVGPSGRVLAFEPSGRNAAALQRNLAINDISNVAVFVAAVSDGSSHLVLAPGSESFWTRVEGANGREGEPVDQLVLDDIASEYAPPSLVKIDVEGHELHVLNGMVEVARRHHPIVVCESDFSSQIVTDALHSLGYGSVISLSWRRNGPSRHYVAS